MIERFQVSQRRHGVSRRRVETHGEHRIGGDHEREDRGIHDTDIGHPLDPELRIDNRELVVDGSHLASSGL